MHEIARTRVRYGYRRVHVLLKREGWHLGRNQVRRLYREKQLQLRSKPSRRRKMVVARTGNALSPVRWTTSGVWTSSRISWPMERGFEP
jgi:putative transposase